MAVFQHVTREEFFPSLLFGKEIENTHVRTYITISERLLRFSETNLLCMYEQTIDQIYSTVLSFNKPIYLLMMYVNDGKLILDNNLDGLQE